MSRYDIRVEMAEKFRGVEYWYAYEDQRFDAELDGDGYVGNYAQGTGGTKWDAIEDLLLRIRDQEDREQEATNGE